METEEGERREYENVCEIRNKSSGADGLVAEPIQALPDSSCSGFATVRCRVAIMTMVPKKFNVTSLYFGGSLRMKS